VVPALQPFGDTAWRAHLPEGGDGASRRALFEALRALPDVVDVVVSEHHVLVVLAPGAPGDDGPPRTNTNGLAWHGARDSCLYV